MSAARKKRLRPFLRLALPTLVLLPLVSVSTFWHRPTRIQLEIATTRLAFTLGGETSHEILDRSVPFSSLVLERCGAVTFAAEKLEIADPQQLVPGTTAGETLHFPSAAWRALKPTDPVKLSCDDPAAKLTLKSPDPGAVHAGILDRIHFKPSSEVILEVSPGEPRALRLEIGTPQELSLLLGPDLEFVADFVEPEGIALPFPGNLQTWRAQLPEGRRTLHLTSGEQGLALIVTATRGTQLFRSPLDLPLASVELLQEELEGSLTSALRDKARLSYPEYPTVPAVTIEPNEAIGLGGLAQTRLQSLDFDAGQGVLRARLDGMAERATSRAGAFTRDHRLTLFHTFRYSWRWGLIAVTAAWLVSTTLAAVEVWKKLPE